MEDFKKIHKIMKTENLQVTLYTVYSSKPKDDINTYKFSVLTYYLHSVVEEIENLRL